MTLDTEQKIAKPRKKQFRTGFCKPRGSKNISLALLQDAFLL